MAEQSTELHYLNEPVFRPNIPAPDLAMPLPRVRRQSPAKLLLASPVLVVVSSWQLNAGVVRLSFPEERFRHPSVLPIVALLKGMPDWQKLWGSIRTRGGREKRFRIVMKLWRLRELIPSFCHWLRRRLQSECYLISYERDTFG